MCDRDVAMMLRRESANLVGNIISYVLKEVKQSLKKRENLMNKCRITMRKRN